jgi:hypothetical protein
MQRTFHALVSGHAQMPVIPAKELRRMELGPLREAEFILQSLSHRLGGLSGVVPRCVMDQ